MIKIDKKVPIPPCGKRGGPAKYPWKTMQIGDSFFVEKHPHKFCGNISRAEKSTGFDFVIRKDGNGCRVWRIK